MKRLLDRLLLVAAGLVAAGLAWGSLAALNKIVGGEAGVWIITVVGVVAVGAYNRSLRKKLRQHGIEP